MATFKCPKCKAEISTQDAVCPQCGHVLMTAADAAWTPTVPVGRTFKTKGRSGQIAIAVILVLLLGAFFFTFLHDTKKVFDGHEFDVNPGQSQSFDFVLGQKVTMTEIIDVVSGPPVDVYLMTDPQYEAYKDFMDKKKSGTFEHEEALRALDARSVSQSATLTRKKYYLVVRSTAPVSLSDAAHVSQVKMSLIAAW